MTTVCARVRRWAPLALATGTALWLAACTVAPTPYQPKGETGYGYQETRLQKTVYRVSFRANRETSESVMVDYLFLRSAQLTKAAGYPYFLVLDRNLGTPAPSDSGASVGFSLGFGMGGGNSFTGFGLGIAGPVGGDGSGRGTRLGMFQIRMLTAEQAKQYEKAYKADDILKNLSHYEHGSAKPKP